MAIITVNSFEDNSIGDGLITLREAIEAANTDTSVDGSTAGSGADTIVFDASLAGQTITLASQLVISSDVIITGLGADQLTISGNNATRIFNVNDRNNSNQVDVTIEGLTLTEGDTTGDGGAINNQENLTVTNSTISGNSSDRSGGGIFTRKNLTVTNSTISGNSSDRSGGGIYNDNSSSTNNSRLTVSNSTISGNFANFDGGGIYNYYGTLTVSSSTISDNSSSRGAGIHNYQGIANVTSTIIARNTSEDIEGSAFTSGGNNLIGNGDYATGFTNGVNGDIVGTAANPIDPKLAPLADNGATTLTHALQSDSPAIGAGSNPDNLTIDQRGETRVAGTSADIGAFEFGIVVTSLEDNTTVDGQVTLREALQAANNDISVDGSTAGSGADTIIFDASLAGQTINLASELVISSDVIITGLGADQLTISGNNATRIFYVDDGNFSNQANVTIEGLTLTAGNSTGGGAIYSQENLTLSNSTISGNSATFFGGGINNNGTLTVSNSTISGNSANSFSGGINNNGTLTVSNSTISGNSATFFGGGINNEGILTVSNSTISGNSATFFGSGIYNNGTTTIASTIIAGNISDDIDGSTFTSGGNNLIGNGDTATGFTNGTNGDIVGTTANPIDPGLDPLADNGGTTQTHALQSDSPAIDAGSNPNNLTTDQRGEVRVAGTSADIGAFEARFPAITATLTDNLLLDFNFDALLNPGETVRYTAIINNSGNDTSNNTIFQLTPDSNTTLSVGSVTTTTGTVTTGNTGGDTTIAVDIGTVAISGSVTITFDVVVNNPVSVTQISTQGTVSGSNFTNVLTDDPDDGTSNSDVTISNVVPIPPTVSITASTPNATEGGSDGVFTISRDDSNGDLSVNLTINGSSSAVDTDYSLNGGSVTVAGSTVTVTIPDGSTSIDVNLSAVVDIVAEPAETLQLDIAADSNYVIDGVNNSATVTIDASLAPQLVINEIDYDQFGADGDNFIELLNNGTDTINLSGYQILLVNENGTPYDTINLDNVDLAAGDYYVISNNATNIANTNQQLNFTLQNGVDAVALVFGSDIIDTVSYEGDTTGYTEGAGTTVADLNDFANVGLSRFPNGTDTDDNSADFVLQGITPGTLNSVTPSVTLSINPDPANLNDGGSTATITAVIDTFSGQDVTINLAFSGTATEGLDYTVPNSITIPAGQLSADITLTTVEDFMVEGDETIVVDIDSVVNGLESGNEQVNATIIDDDTSGITVTPTTGLTTTEAGDTTQFTVVLDSQPSNDVVVSFTSDNTTEGTTDVSSLTFTSGNWDIPQTVTVTGVDDFIDDDDVAYTISTNTTSSDPNYDNLTGNPVTVINQDDGDTAGITINQTTLTTSENLTTDEFNVVLDSQPVADVVINFTNPDDEGSLNFNTLTFTATNWNTPQTVIVTGVDDDIDDGDITYTLDTSITSTDLKYNAIAPVDLTITNTDNDIAGVTVSPISNNTTEAGDSSTFTIVLDTQPIDNVVVSLVSSNIAEGTIDQNFLTFTSANWNNPQTVTVTGVDDDVDDGDINYTIATTVTSTGDTNYDGIAANDVTVTNIDNDAIGVTVTPTSLTTSEAEATAEFTLKLNTQPTGNVVIALNNSDVTEGSLAQNSLTFTSANWNTPQTVTVTGVDDDVDDGDIQYEIVTSIANSADTDYAALSASDINNVTVINTDDDQAGVTFSPISIITDEQDDPGTLEVENQASFTVVLDVEPIADVTVTLINNEDEGSLDQNSLIFTSSNWDTPQTVTFTADDDFINDGDITFNIGANVSSADSTYNFTIDDAVSVTNRDNNTVGVSVSPISNNTSEAGDTAEFTFVLDSQPSADVTVNFTNPEDEGSLNINTLTFTATNWNIPQTIIVTGVDDDVDDGDIIYTITTEVNTTDIQYSALNPEDLVVTNLDDDTAAIAVTVVDNQTTEAGDTAQFTFLLESQPTEDVAINFTNPEDEGSLNINTLTFTATNWNIPQTLIVTGVDDDVDDGDIIYTITTEVTTTDIQYSALNPEDLVVTNLDDDDADISEDDNNTITPSLSYPENNNIFAIEGNPDTEITLEFSLNNEVSANFVNEVGLILVDDINGGIDTNGDGNIDLNPDDDNYAEIALASGQVIFSALPGGLGNNQISSTIRNLPTGKFLSFYLVQNSTTDNFIESTNNQTTPPPVFFSSVVSNEDIFNHLEVTELENGDFIVSFEDQFNGGDQDFNDLNLRVRTTNANTAIGTNLQISQGLEVFDLTPYDGQLIRGEFTVLPSSDASFNNLVGIYIMADEQGTIIDPVTGDVLTPGDINYAQVARDNSIVEFDRNGIDPVLLLGGFSYGTYLVADGVNGGEEVFFPFLDANSDNLDYIRLLGDNTFGFEDLVGGGDFSYDDFVYQAEFTLV